jgi:K+-sensing histidine kinase KdpD
MADQPTILCVDDEPMMLDILEGYLHHDDYTLIRYSSGVELLQDFRNLSTCDMILLDVMMPEMDGIEVTRLIRQSQSRFLPILMITALGTTEHKVMGLDAGASDFITKPVSEAELRARVKAHLRAKQTQVELIRTTNYKDKLVSMIVHDIRNPLTMIYMALEIIRECEDPREIEQSLWIRAWTQTKAALEMCEQLLDVKQSEQSSFRLHPTSDRLSRTVNEAIAAISHHTSTQKVAIHSELEDIVLHTDHFHLRRVLINVLQNAVMHSGRHSQVLLRSQLDSRKLTITISDNGIGIPRDDLSGIFNMYEAVASGSTNFGRGIGLAYCRMAIEFMGGSIDVESEPGEGCLFRICLPINCPISREQQALQR